MKAIEVLRRYKAGERDFRRANLQGQSFKGEDLSGANFSEADIRGANFGEAVLHKANFALAEAGLQLRQVVLLLSPLFLLSGFIGFASGLFGYLVASPIDSDILRKVIPALEDSKFLLTTPGALTSCLSILTALSVFFFFTFREGWISGLRAIALLFIPIFSLAFLTAFNTVFVNAGFIAFTIIGIGVTNVTSILIFACAVAVTSVRILPAIILFSTVIAVNAAIIFAGEGTQSSTIIVAGIVDCINAVLNALASYFVLSNGRDNEKFATIFKVAIAFAAIEGTNFQGAKLNNADFTKAILKSTNFNSTKQQQTILMQVLWQNAKQLDCARLGNTYLADTKIRQLVIRLNGQGQNYDGLNLERVNLQGANLQDASFVVANLNHTNLQDVNLSRATLKQTQLDGTDLTGATLTGAYIEDWGITGTTKLNGVQCDYIFMRVPTKENPVPLRKPDNQREMFADGEFTDFIQPYVTTLDLYHSQDVDPRAISIAFKELSQNHLDADLEIVAMERRGQNSLNLKVRTAPTADKSELSTEYFANYNQLKTLPEARLLLLAKDDRIRSLEQMIQTALHQPTFNVQGDFMPEQNRKINVGRDLTISGSTLNLGEISGTVTNTINQLPDRTDPDQPNLKQLLKQLQEAIETDPDLSDTDKADLLEQLQNLAEAKQIEEPVQKEGLVRKANKMFEATLKSLPDTAKIVEACNKLLPLILKALGFPA